MSRNIIPVAILVAIVILIVAIVILILGVAFDLNMERLQLEEFHRSHQYDDQWTEAISPQGYPVSTIHWGNAEPIICVNLDSGVECRVP